MNEYEKLDLALNYLNEGILVESVSINKSKIKLDCNKKEDEKYFDEAMKCLKKHWDKIIDAVAEDVKNYVDMCIKYGKENKSYVDFCKKYDSIDKIKKSLNHTGGRFLGKTTIKGTEYFDFAMHFHHPVPDRDGHTIFLDFCCVNESKYFIQKCTFEG